MATSHRFKKRKQKYTALKHALEPRVMFDASVVVPIIAEPTPTADVVADPVEHPTLTTDAPTESNQATENTDKSTQLQEDFSTFGATPSTDPTPVLPGKELVFIDSLLWGAEELASYARSNTEVHMLNANEDGVEQISRLLAGESNVSAIHIVSHGLPGTVYLGNSELSLNTLSHYATVLRSWRSSLTADADILIYGCRVAEGATGTQFIEQLGELTGADIGASTDFTGGAPSANWSMEYVWGQIDATLFGDLTQLNAYESRFSTINLAGNTGWTEILYGSRMDPGGDPQAGKASTDLVGNYQHALMYSAYDDKGTVSQADDEVAFRFRVAQANSQGAYGAIGLIGVDADLDGDIDVFIGIDDRSGGAGVTLFNPGTDLNNSPSTTSISASRTFGLNSSNYQFLAVSAATDPNYVGSYGDTAANLDINLDGKTDYFVSFKISFDQVRQELARLNVAGNPPGGIAIDMYSPIRYVMMTSTQNNSINGDFGGIVGSNSSSQTYEQLGAFTPILSMSNSMPIITSGGGGVSANYVAVAGSTSTITTITTLDKDPGDIARYDIFGGADASLFTIDPITGALTFASAAPSASSPIDKNGDGVYEVTVRVRDYDATGTTLKGGSDTQNILVTVTGSADTTRPTLDLRTGISPADNSTGIAPNSNFILNFSESVQAGTGNIYIRNASTGAIVVTIDVADTGQVSFIGGTVTINPIRDLLANTSYYMEIDANAFKDLSGNTFVALDLNGNPILASGSPTGVNDTDPTTPLNAYKWNFTTGGNATADAINPTLVSATVTSPAGTTLSPADNQTGVAIGTNIVLTFSEAVFADSGYFIIRKSTDGSIVAKIAASDTTQVTYNSVAKTVTINPTSDLAENTSYYIEIEGGALQDQAGNRYAGIINTNQGTSNSYTLNFTTAADTIAPTITQVSAANADGAWIAGDTITVRVKFSEVVFVTGTPTLQLETGTVDRTINYVSGSGTDTLIFSYVVQNGDTSSDLNYVATNSLTLNGGTIKDNVGNSAITTLPNLGSGNDLAGQKNIVIDIAPVNSIPTSQNVEGTNPLVFNTAHSNLVSVSDTDSSNVTVTLTATNGVITLSGTAGLTFSLGNGTNNTTMTFTGSKAAVNSALNGMQFNANSGFIGNASMQIVTRDGITSVNGVIVQDSDTIAITVSTPISPVIGNGGTTLSYSENAGAVLINPLLTVSDPDSTVMTSAVVSIISNYINGQDILSFTNDGLTMGNISGSFNAGTGELSLSGNATLAEWQAALRAIKYTNTSEAPSTSARTISYSISDGTNSSSSVQTTINVTPVNDAPVLAQTALTLNVAEDAGIPTGAVGSLISTFTGGITDIDSGSAKGIAIIAADETYGTWYYSTNGGTTWNAVGVVSTAQSLLLADNANTRLYFSPVANFNGNASHGLTIRAWDTSNGTLGSKTSTGITGGTSAFSTASNFIDVTVTSVNDAPIASGTATLSADLEDTALASLNKNTIFNLFSANFSDSADQITGGSSANILAGVAIVNYTANASMGSWQYSVDGNNWITVNSVSDAANAITLKSTDQLRFVPATNFSGSAPTLTVKLIDSSTTVTSGTTVNTAGGGGSTAYSAANVTLDHTVIAANDAPVLSDTTLTLSIQKNSGLPIGAVGSLISAFTGGITDVDSGSVKGIAIVASDETNGTWYYSIDGGTNWIAVGSVSTTNALILADNSNTRLYFSPATNYQGSSPTALTVKGWDQSDGKIAGSKIDASVSGGSTAYSNSSDVIDVIVTPINTAPVLVDINLTMTTNEDAGVPSGAVGTLVSAFTGGITDVDTSALKGIAIVGSDETNGTWYYTTNGGTTWTAVSTVSSAQSLLLADDANTRLYFSPINNFNGAASAALTIRAWDQASGTAGTKVSTAVTGGTSAYSSATDTINVTVTPANDAPSVGGTLTISTTEDVGAPSGAVGSLVSVFTTGFTDVDTAAQKGIAITAVNETNGIWWYSTDGGNSWIKVGTVSDSSALLLTDNASTRLYFQANSNYNVTSLANAVTLRAWDQTSGTPGTKVNVTTNGGTTAFSSSTIGITLTVTGVNDAPTAALTTVTLAAVNEDTASPAGATVSSLFASAFSDAIDQVSGGSTQNTLAGIVIVANSVNTSTQGNWQWDNGGVWTNISTTLSVTNGLVLAQGTGIRFLANANYTGTPGALSVRLIDSSAGAVTSGTSVNLSTLGSGGITQYSAINNEITLTTSVTSVNDAPTAVGRTIVSQKASAYKFGRADFGFADSDSPADIFYSVKIISLPTGSGTFLLNGVAVTVNQEILVSSIDAGLLTWTSSANGNGANGSFTYQVRDASASGLLSATATMSFQNASKDAPTISDTIDPTTISYTENAAGVSIAPNITIVDSSNLTSFTVSIGNFVAGDTLTWTNAGLITNANAIYNSTTGVLTITVSDTAANYQTVLRSLKFSSTSDNPTANNTMTTRFINFQGVDATATGNPINFNVTVSAVNDAPVATGSATLATDLEDTATASLTRSTVSALFSSNFSDGDLDALGGIAVSSYTADGTKGTWQYSSDGTNWNTLNSVSAVTSAFTLKSTDYLRFVPAANFNGAAPSLSVKLIDSSATVTTGATVNATGGGATVYSSASVVLSHNITSVNDAPTLSVTATNPTYVEKTVSPSTLFSGATITMGASDESSQSIKTLQLVVTGLADGTNEKLTIDGVEFNLTNGTTGVTGVNAIIYNVSVSGSIATVTLTRTGDMSAATAQSVINNMGYRNTSNAPTGTSRNATITLIQDNGGVSQGGVDVSNVAISSAITITPVNDAPTLTNSSTVSFTEGNSPIVINSSITVTDSDNPTLLSATVSIVGGTYSSGQDVLAFTPNVNTGNIIASYNASTGVLTLTSPNNSATAAQFAAALQAVTYFNSSESPNTTARSISFVVNDGSSNSNTITSTVNVSVLNDAPILADRNVTFTVTEDAGVPSGGVGSLLSALTGGISDSDAGALLGVAIVNINQTNGTWYYSTNNGGSWSTIGTASASNALLLANDGNTRLYFAPASNYNGTTEAALTFRAWDTTNGAAGSRANITSIGTGGSTAFSSATDVVDVSVSAINDAPIASGSATLAAIAEDSTNPIGATVNSLFGSNFSDSTDQVPGGSSANTFAGIVIIANGSNSITEGKWQWNNAGTWTDISTSVSVSNGLVLSQSTSIRFLPNTNFDGAPGSLTVRLIDSSSGQVLSGDTANVTVSGGATAYSSGSVVLSTTIIPVNHAPTLSDTALTLNIAEDSSTPVGAVGSLLNSFTGEISDLDSSPSTGIAVIATDELNGTWYYSTNNGSSWNAVGTVNATQALLLANDGNTRLYFKPGANYNGTANSALTFRAWDTTSGTAGTKVNASSFGGNTEFSSAIDSIDVTVTAISDAPIANGTANLAADLEDSAISSLNSSAISALFAANFSDATDNVAGGSTGDTLAGVAIISYTADATKGTWEYSSDGTTWNTLNSINSVTSAYTLKSIDQLRFVPVANYNGTAPAITVKLIDSSTAVVTGTTVNATGGGTTAYSTNTVILSHTVTAENDAPVLTVTPGLSLNSVLEDAAAPSGAVGTLISNIVSSTDIDANALSGIAITSLDTTQGVWYYSTDNGTNWIEITVTPSSTDSLLLAADANTRLYFQPTTINYNGLINSAVTFRAWDQTIGSNGGTFNTTIHGGNTAFSSTIESAAITVTSVNDAPMGADAIIWVDKNGSYTFQAADFGFSDAGDTPANTFISVKITAIPNVSAGVLKLSGVNVTVNQVIAVSDLSNLVFTPTANQTGLGLGFILFRVQDSGGGQNTDTTDRAVLFNVGSRTPPTLSGGSTIGYTENVGGVVVNENVEVFDLDNLTLESATVSITRGYAPGEDLLQFTNDNLTMGNITVSGFADGVLTLTSSGATATHAEWQSALRAVKYLNTSDSPSAVTRGISYTIYDGTNSSDVVQSSIVMTPLNDAPVLNITHPTLNAVLEDAPTPSGAVGTLVSSLVSGQTDLDSDALKGIAITSLNSTNGTWYYSIDGGSQWAAISSAPSDNASLLLAADANTRLYFKPNLNFNGNTSFTFRAWDQTAGSNGGTINSSTTGGTSAFSNVSDTATLTVTAVSDAPSGADNTITIARNSTKVFSVSDFQFNDVNDSPADTFNGIYITSLPVNGSLLYNGTVISNATLGSPFFVANVSLLTFNPTAGESGTGYATFGFKVQDTGATTNGGFNIDSTERLMTINVSVNQAPTVAGSSTVNYTENQASIVINSGITVTATDAPNASSAIISISDGFVSSQDILSFTNTSTITGSYNAATGVLTLTGVDTMANYEAALHTITYSNTSDAPNAADRKVSFVVLDSDSVSSETVLSTINITAVNDAPVLANSSSINYTENDLATPINASITLNDLDNSIIESATVTITNFMIGEDVLSFTPNANTGNITANFNAATGILTLTSSNNSGTTAQFQAALRAVHYANTSDNPTTTARDITFVINDGSSSNNLSNEIHSTVNVTSVNDASVLSNSSTITYTENDAAKAINTAITIADADSLTLTSATISITNYIAGEDVLAFAANANTGNITASFDSTTGILTLTSPDNSGTPAQFQAALRAVTYANSSETPTTTARHITFETNDGDNSNVIHSTINVVAVNDATVLANTSTILYTENDAATPINVNLTVSDTDNTTLLNATVTITNYVAGEDILAFVANANTGNIQATFNVVTGVLTLTSPDNSGTPAQFQAALRAVTYANTSNDPTTTARDITFETDDGGANNNVSNVIHSTINIAAVNDVTTLGGGSSTILYTENDAATVINANITVNDVDNTVLDNALVTITNFISGEDVLSFVPNANTGNIAASFNATTGVLTLTSPDNSGTAAQFQAALRAVYYANTSDNPTTTARDITFVIDDGSATSEAVHNTVNVVAVNDVTVLNNASTIFYTENDAATSINVNLTVSDTDSATLLNATVTITNYVAGEDILSFVANANTGNIQASFNSTTGELTLSSPDNSGTPAQFQAALRAVKYVNTSDNPTATPRDITFVTNDGNSSNNISNIIHNTVNIDAINDAPTLSNITTLTYIVGSPAAIINPNVSLVDLDSTVLSSATVSITNFVAGEDVLSFVGNQYTGNITANFNATTGVLTLTSPDNSGTPEQFQAALRAVRYVNTSNTPSDTARDITFITNDGNATNNLSNVIHSTISIAAFNNPPVLANSSTINYVENASSAVINEDITVADTDSSTLDSAIVTITNYVAGEDILSFVSNANTGNITAVFDSSGILTLRSPDNSATASQFEAALRAVHYANTSDNPTTTARDITFVINDGSSSNNLSNEIHSTVNVTSVNDASVLSNSSTITYTENDAAKAINTAITITDADNLTLTSATVSITNYIADEDVLAFAANASTGNITASFDSTTGVLTLTSPDNSGTPAQFQAALRAVTYANSSETPTTTARDITFETNDGINSNVIHSTINVVAVNDATVLANASTILYTENDAATPINVNLTVSDTDSATLLNATVTITNYVAGEDILAFVANANTGNIQATFNAVTGVLTLTSPDNSGTPAQFQAALRAVTYANTSNDPTTTARDVTFETDDGSANNHVSNVIHSTINIAAVNDVTTLSGGASTILYTENDAATVINANITVNDVDNTVLDHALVTITNFISGEDVLSFVPNANTGNIAASFNATTGVLTLTSPDNSGTAAQFQAALRAVYYANTSDNPTTTARDITFVIDDGSATSEAVHNTVNVVAVNDVTVLNNASTLFYTENDAATPINVNLTVSDTDSATLLNATVTITNYVAGEDILSFVANANTGNIQASFNTTTGELTLSSPDNSGTPAQFQAALRAVKYVNTSDNPTATARDITFVTNDGANSHNISNIIHSTINIAVVDDAPTLNNSSTINYLPNSGALPINTNLIITDADSATLLNATITIANYIAEEDSLSFVPNANTGNIVADFDPLTGVLTLTSPDNSGTPAQFQAALRSVHYINTSIDPTVITKDIAYVVDSGSSSNNLSNVMHSAVAISLPVPVNIVPPVSIVDTTPIMIPIPVVATQVGSLGSQVFFSSVSSASKSAGDPVAEAKNTFGDSSYSSSVSRNNAALSSGNANPVTVLLSKYSHTPSWGWAHTPGFVNLTPIVTGLTVTLNTLQLNAGTGEASATTSTVSGESAVNNEQTAQEGESVAENTTVALQDGLIKQKILQAVDKLGLRDGMNNKTLAKRDIGVLPTTKDVFAQRMNFNNRVKNLLSDFGSDNSYKA